MVPSRYLFQLYLTFMCFFLLLLFSLVNLNLMRNKNPPPPFFLAFIVCGDEHSLQQIAGIKLALFMFQSSNQELLIFHRFSSHLIKIIILYLDSKVAFRGSCAKKFYLSVQFDSNRPSFSCECRIQNFHSQCKLKMIIS